MRTNFSGSTDNWLQLEEGNRNAKFSNIETSFYSSRSRVGITGFIMDCIAGKQDEQEPTDIEKTTQQLPVVQETDSIIAVLAASTQIVMSAVTNITTGISNLFTWSSQNDSNSENTQKISAKAVDLSQLLEVVIEGYSGTPRNNEDISKLNAQINEFPTHGEENQVFTTTVASENKIESPRLSTIQQSRSQNSFTKQSRSTDLVNNDEDKSEYVDTGNYWYEPNFEEDDEECDLSSSSKSCSALYAMQSYIDFSLDCKIVQKPIPRRSNIKKRDVQVKFEPIVELMDYVVNNDKVAIKKILQAGAIGINDHDKLGYTMMHYAACHNHLDLIKYFLEKGANINSLDYTNWSPLHMAAIADNFKVCKYLLENGANFECPNDDNNLPIDLAEDDRIKKLLTEATKKKLSAKKVKALYDWTAQTPECLSVKKSESLRVMDRQNQDWWLLQNDQKQIGLVPRSFVQ